MKRILSRKSLICLCCISVFFTGCNEGSVSTDFEIPTYETAAPPESRGREREDWKLLETKESKMELEKENGKLISERFDNVTGEPAFWMPEAHSAEKDDLIFFQVLDLVDGYFYYFYVTTNIETGEEVHAVVKNNYKNKADHKILYEVKGKKKTVTEANETGRERPPFYAQMYKKANSTEYMISIYDDGNLYVFDSEGELDFERTSENSGEDMLMLLKRIFRVSGDSPSYYDIDVVNVMTDRKRTFYIPVSLSRQDYTKIKDGEDIDVDNYMFFYSFIPIDEEAEYLLQENDELNKQIDYWKDMADDATEKRDAQKDWEDAVRAYPDRWGSYGVYTKIDTNPQQIGTFWKWNQEDVRIFIKDKSENPSTRHDAKYASMVNELSDKQSLNGYFFADDENGYCSLVGQIDTVKTEQMEIERTYSVTSTGEDGNPVTQEQTETILVDHSKIATFSPATAIERFEVVKDWIGFSMVQGHTEGDDKYTIGIYKDNIYVLQRFNDKELTIEEKLNGIDGTENIPGIFPGIEDDQNQDELPTLDIQLLNRVNGEEWLMASDISNGRILLGSSSFTPGPVVLMISDLNPKGYQSSEADQVLTEKMRELAGEHSKDKAYDFSEVDIYSAADRYGRENVIVLSEKEFLFTTFHNGMQLYKMNGGRGADIGQSTPGTITWISDWPLYQAWEEEDGKITAIGFDQTDVTFFAMDIAKARVYTFDLQENQAVVAPYNIPFEDGKGAAGIGRKPLESQEVPDEMKKSWEKAKQERETAAAPPVSEAESIPSVTIYETNEAMGKFWESKEAELKEERGGENDGE